MTDFDTAIDSLTALMSEAQRMRDTLVVSAGRVLDACRDFESVDDDNARRAILIAKRAVDQIRNAEVGSLNDFLNDTQGLIMRLRS